MRALGLGRISGSLFPIYLAVVVLGSIVAHLASEFFAMGSEADSVALSPKHIYLGVAALVAAAFALRQIQALFAESTGMRDFKRTLALGLETLPFRGRGLGFYGLTAGLQLVIGLATQYGEGCPFCGHDILAGILGAFVTVVALALVARAIGARLPGIAAAFASFFYQPATQSDALVVSRAAAALPAQRFFWFSQLFNRPPPLSVA